MRATFEGRLVRETPNRIAIGLRSVWIASSVALLPIYGVGFDYLPAGLLIAIGAAWFPATFGLIPILRRFARLPDRQLADVRIERDGIRVNGKLIVRRRDLRSGATHAASAGTMRITLAYRPTIASAIGIAPVLVLYARDVAEAETLLAAAGVDVQQHVYRATFWRPRAAWHVVLGLAIYVTLGVVFFMLHRQFFDPLNPVLVAIPVLLASAIAFLVYTQLARTVVIVGNDGVGVRVGTRRRFFRLDEIRGVNAGANELVITLTSGEQIAVAHAAPFGEPVGNFGASDIEWERRLVAERITQATRMHQRRSQARNAEVTLGRSGRSTQEWLAFVKGIGAGISDYRTSVVPVEELRRAVTDTNLANDVRVGAAIALRVADQAAAERIRIAAEATAEPDLRALLDDIADASDDDALRRHLTRL